jgi:zinc/manganese transport system permease protein
VFAATVGLAVAQAVQLVGALLLLALVATPAAVAQQWTARPWRGVGLSAAIAVLGLWAGIAISYAASRLPPSFAVVTLLFLFYAATVLVRRRRQ